MSSQQFVWYQHEVETRRIYNQGPEKGFQKGPSHSGNHTANRASFRKKSVLGCVRRRIYDGLPVMLTIYLKSPKGKPNSSKSAPTCNADVSNSAISGALAVAVSPRRTCSTNGKIAPTQKE